MARILFLFLLLFFTSAQSFADYFYVDTNCSNCLYLRNSNLRWTSYTIPKDTRVRVAGPERNGHYPVYFIQNRKVVIYYLPSRYLRRNRDRHLPTVANEPSRPFTRGDAFPISGSEESRKSWVFNQLKYWIALTGQNMINKNPRDLAQYCPNYATLSNEQKVEMWATMLTQVSYFESKYDTNTTYRESFTDSTGARVISTGLFQLSRESARGYGCPVSSTQDLKDPNVNLQCAVKIMGRWVDRDNMVGRGTRGGGRYWSVFRGTTNYTSLARASIIDSTKKYCAAPTQASPEAEEDHAPSFVGV